MTAMFFHTLKLGYNFLCNVVTWKDFRIVNPTLQATDPVFDWSIEDRQAPRDRRPRGCPKSGALEVRSYAVGDCLS